MLIYLNNFFHFCLILIGCILSSTASPAQTSQSPPATPWSQFIRLAPMAPTQERIATQEYYLVELKAPLQRASYTKKALQIKRILDQNFLIIEGQQPLTTAQQSGFKNIWVANHQWKLAPSLLVKTPLEASTIQDFLIKTETHDCIRQLLSHHPALKHKRIGNQLHHIQTSPQFIEQFLLNLPCVSFVSQESLQPKMESKVADMNLSANAISYLKRHYPEANGQDELISIKENFYDVNDIDLINKHLSSPLDAEAVNLHTTEMATIIAGLGNSSYNGKGVAPYAQLTSSSFNTLLPDEVANFEALKLTVQNHSYGTSIENFYGNLASAYDQNAYEKQDLLHIFSAGNQGYLTAPIGSGSYTDINGYGNLTGNFKMAKNILTVGCVDTVGNLLLFSSRGPAHDGRVKPEIVAYSTQGTSNATALVSGTASLLQQRFSEDHPNQTASASLIKALLINAADDVEAPGLDHRTGYGNLNAYRSYQNLVDQRYRNATVQTNQEQSFFITIPNDAQDLKISLVWTDLPALPNANRALVNDLDLKLITPTGETILPWILSSVADSTALAQEATRGEDHLNNVEQITLHHLEPGEYKIIVSATDLSSPEAAFAIAYQWDTKETFQWIFPTASDNMPFDGETTSYFRWETNLSTESGVLEYSLDNGTSWILINENIDLQKGRYRWVVPEGVSGSAIARIRTNLQSYPTETFTVSQLPFLRVGFECGDSVLISWSAEAAAVGYRIYSLQDQHMQPVHTTTNQFYIFHQEDFIHPYFAVAPVFADNKVGIRSSTINYQLLSNGCYINSFYLENLGQTGLNVHLDLGTAYGIDRIIIQRATKEAFIDLGIIADPSPLSLDFTDTAPAQGFNQYRAKLLLDNGDFLYSDLATGYFLSEQAYLVFPNPAAQTTGFNVFSKDFSSEVRNFELFSHDGKLVLQRQLQTDREFITTKGLSPGVYTYRISTAHTVEVNKILIQ